MNEPLSKLPGGMRYYFGGEARLRRAVENAVMSVFDGWGYEEIATPVVDYYALFERGMGRPEAQRTFRFTDTDGRMLALRPDVTSAVARAAATLFSERARPLRFCYAASVFRQRPRSHAEWKRQTRQLGCELIGAGVGVADVEVLVIAAEVLERLGLRARYRITLNHAGILRGVSQELGLDEAAREELRRLIDIRDGAGLEALLAGCGGANAAAASLAMRLVRLTGKRGALEEARAVSGGPHSSQGLCALAEIWGVIEALDLAECFEIDLGDVSGMNYYTGLVFRIYVEGAGARVGSGGRYDELASNFGRREPAVGFVLDLDALGEVLGRGGAEELSDMPERAASVVEGGGARELFMEARRRRAEGERIALRTGGE
ncbi:MAG: ATP phosphoribosyltransferase regulatory subunit [Acidobacteria bacterium]|nr:ATP phosphoribosyltransferase regulatory subunit [Acidobacteriota bacterium]